MSADEAYPGRGRVLVVGLDPGVNKGVVEPLVAAGVDAQGCTRPDEAINRFDARDFELIVFGRGVLGPLSEQLKRAFVAQNPDVRFIDVIAPVVVAETLAALVHDPRTPQFVSDVEVSTDNGAIRVTATIVAPCHLIFTVFRSEGGTLTAEEQGEANAEPGPFCWTSPAADLQNASGLLLTAGGTQYHLHPFLKRAQSRPSALSDPAAQTRNSKNPDPTQRKEHGMDARINLFENPALMKFAKYVNSAGRVIHESTLPRTTQELVKLRASQINGCGFCTDMHTKDAVAAGESQLRLNLVAVWREATVFTEAERAALELTEQGTRIADAAGGVTDDAWANAAKHYDDEQLGALVATIAVINTYNRLNVIIRQPAGDYEPGQFDQL